MKLDKRLNIRLLEVFAAVVQHQGYSGAQQALNLTASAISNHMSELEGQLGFVLCHRGRAGFMLTEKGQQFYHSAMKLLGEMEALNREAEALKGDMGGTFHLAILDSTVLDSAFSLPEVIREFNERFPQVYINLHIRTPYEQWQGILNNQLDLAVGNFPFSVNNVIEKPLYEEQHWLFCSDEHPFFNAPNLTIDQVAQHGLVTRSYWSDSDLRKRGFEHGTATVETMEAQLALILSGRYLGYLPEHFVQNFVNNQRLCALLPNEFGYKTRFSMICRRGRSRELFVRTMSELLLKRCSNQ